jgi:hypothetical protein
MAYVVMISNGIGITSGDVGPSVSGKKSMIPIG